MCVYLCVYVCVCVWRPAGEPVDWNTRVQSTEVVLTGDTCTFKTVCIYVLQEIKTLLMSMVTMTIIVLNVRPPAGRFRNCITLKGACPCPVMPKYVPPSAAALL